MHRLIHTWEQTYYSELFLLICLLTTLFVSIKYRKVIPELKYLSAYLFAFIILFSSTDLDILFRLQPHNVVSFALWSQDFAVSVIEFFVFSNYLSSIYSNRTTQSKYRTISKTVSILFIILFAYSTYSHIWNHYWPLHLVYCLESIILIIGCITYFHQIYMHPPQHRLKSSSHFWIVTGLVFYLICTIPITIASPYLVEKQHTLYLNLFSLIYIFYIILFSTIIRAFLCKPQQMA